MPPRRRAAAAAAPPAQPPLDGHVVALSGKFGKPHASLEAQVRSLGGSVSRSVTKSTTHLVCTESDYLEASNKVTAARAAGLPVLTPDWLFDAIEQNKKLAEADYAWADQADKADDEMADVAADDVDVEADDTETKATRATRATKARGKANAQSSDSQVEDTKANGITSKAKAKTNGKVDTAASSNKRTIADAKSDEDEELPKPKKTRGVKAQPAKTTPPPPAPAKVAQDEVKAETEDTKEEKVVAEGQFAKKKGLVVPLDERCPLATYEVYVDPDSGMIWDAALNQTNVGYNNNKFYRIQLLFEAKTGTYKTWTRWGRVGEAGQSAILGSGSLSDAVKNFEKKFKDKSGHPWDKRDQDPKPGKYAFVEKNYNPDDSDDEEDGGGDAKEVKKEDDEESDAGPECTLEKPIKELMELIFNQEYFQQAMSALNYDANKMPLGKLGKNTILRGFQQLKDLAALFDDASLAGSKWGMTVPEATSHLCNTYYSLIPHDFGRNRPPIIQDNRLLKKEIDLLESLSDMKAAIDLMKVDRNTRATTHPLDTRFLNLGMAEMTTLDKKSTEFSYLSNYLKGSIGSTHSTRYKVDQIFRIERNGEKERFDQSEYSKIASDRRLLWHGSRCTNFGGILSQGLRIAPPEAPSTGYMFGKGIYLADMSSKSAGYCASYNSNGHALLLLCEAELGDPMQKLTNASYEAGTTAKKNGMYSTWGQGNTGPSEWIDAGIVHESLKGIKMPDPNVAPGPTNVLGAGLHYNEYIVYDTAQVKLRYLLRVKM